MYLRSPSSLCSVHILFAEQPACLSGVDTTLITSFHSFFIHYCLYSFFSFFLHSFLPSFLLSFLPSFLPSFFLPSFIPSFLLSCLSRLHIRPRHFYFPLLFVLCILLSLSITLRIPHSLISSSTIG